MSDLAFRAWGPGSRHREPHKPWVACHLMVSVVRHIDNSKLLFLRKLGLFEECRAYVVTV